MNAVAPIKVCILGVTFDTGNMGVSMLAAGAIRCVLHRFPDAEIILLDYAHEGYEFNFSYGDRQVPIHFVNLRFSKRLYLANNIALLLLLAFVLKLLPFQGVRRWLLRSNGYLREMLECDLVFSMAYGDSFSDIYGMVRLLYVTLPQFLAVLAGKRLVLLPQTVGPFRSKAAKVIARNILRHAEAVYSRDHVGIETTRGLLGRGGDGKTVRFCYDLAFDVDPVPPARVDIAPALPVRSQDSSVVGVNVSGLLLMGGYDRNNMFGLKVEYEQLIHRLIGFLIKEKSATVLLIPHVFGGAEDLESDSVACEKVFESLRTRHEGKIRLVRGNYDYDEIKHIIGRCDFFVGARMHACIGALSQSVPTVPIAYSAKFAGMMQTIGCENLVVDPRHMDEDEIMRNVARIYEMRTTVRRELEQKMSLVKETIRKALSEVEGPGRATSPGCAARIGTKVTKEQPL